MQHMACTDEETGEVDPAARDAWIDWELVASSVVKSGADISIQ
eukprot:COSAG03_NODE_16553_length_398_cov_1.006689_1_plen_42_part_01